MKSWKIFKLRVSSPPIVVLKEMVRVKKDSTEIMAFCFPSPYMCIIGVLEQVALRLAHCPFFHSIVSQASVSEGLIILVNRQYSIII